MNENNDVVVDNARKRELTITSDNWDILNIIKNICSNNHIEFQERKIIDVPFIEEDKNGNLMMDGKMLYHNTEIAKMLNTSITTIRRIQDKHNINPVAANKGGLAKQIRYLYSEEQAFKIMALYEKK